MYVCHQSPSLLLLKRATFLFWEGLKKSHLHLFFLTSSLITCISYLKWKQNIDYRIKANISLWQDILFHVWVLMKKISSDNISDVIVLTRARHTLEKTPKNKRIRPTFKNNPYRKTVRWSIPFAINACERVVFCCPTRLHILDHLVTVC